MHQRRAHGGGRLPTVRGVFGEGAFDHFSYLLRDFHCSLAQRNYLTFKDGFDGSGNVIVGTEVQRRIAGQQAIAVMPIA